MTRVEQIAHLTSKIRRGTAQALGHVRRVPLRSDDAGRLAVAVCAAGCPFLHALPPRAAQGAVRQGQDCHGGQVGGREYEALVSVPNPRHVDADHCATAAEMLGALRSTGDNDCPGRCEIS